jgi:hypothetical protein
MESQHTRINLAPLTVRCCSQHSRGGRVEDAADKAMSAETNPAAIADAIRQEQPAAGTDRSSDEPEPAPRAVQ